MMNYQGKWAALAALGTLVIGATSAWAQDAPPPVTDGAVTAAPAPGRATKRPVSYFVDKWGKATGATVLADTATSKRMLALPANLEEATGETLEPSLTGMIKRLPTGTTWAKIYLPAGRSLNADAVAEYALAQAHLFGGVGNPTPPGTIEVMGQKVSGEKADAVAAALNLRPVYIVLDQNRGVSGVASASAMSSEWATMTDEQKKAFAQKQAQDILAMDPKQQQQMMGQMMDQQRQVMQSLMQNMSPEQRQQFFQNMRQMMPFPGGGGRGGRGGDPRRN